MTKRKKKKKSQPKKQKQFRHLEDYLKLMDEEGLEELEISDGKSHVKLVRQSKAPVVSHHTAPRPSTSTKPSSSKKSDDDLNGKIPIKSPINGVFYRAVSPKSPPFAKEGDVVSPGQTLCIVEAMKVMNEITSDVHGKIIAILIENGNSVTADQNLFLIEPS